MSESCLWMYAEFEWQQMSHGKQDVDVIHMGWLRLVGTLKAQVSFAEYSLFYRALLQMRPIILRSLQVVATPYVNASRWVTHCAWVTVRATQHSVYIHIDLHACVVSFIQSCFLHMRKCVTASESWQMSHGTCDTIFCTYTCKCACMRRVFSTVVFLIHA